MTTPGYEGWAIVELMGHVRIAGYVSEVTQYGAAMGRIDIPGEGDQFVATQFFGGGSVYRLTAVSEAAARAVAARGWPQPVRQWELPEPKLRDTEDAEYDGLGEPKGSGPDGMACRACGCTQTNACVDEGGQACWWAEPGLCSGCVTNPPDLPFD